MAKCSLEIGKELMKTQIVQVPYDSGHKDYRMGKGPKNILRHLKAEENFAVDTIEVQDRVAFEIGTSFAVARQVAGRVRDAVSGGAFPLVLAGNCVSCVGTLGGLGLPSPAIIWLDAHADFNTPETTVSGFLDGMALATAVSRCWAKLAATIPGFYPVPERQAVLVGTREFDANERVLFDTSDVHLVDSRRIRDGGPRVALEPVLAEIRTLTKRAYLHIDLDVLDPAEAHVNQFAPPGGLRLAELLEIVGLVRERFVLAAAAITAYDPEYDLDGKTVRAAAAVIRELARH